jgi:hypothetical protein
MVRTNHSLDARQQESELVAAVTGSPARSSGQGDVQSSGSERLAPVQRQGDTETGEDQGGGVGDGGLQAG